MNNIPIRWNMQDMLDERRKPHRKSIDGLGRDLPICDATKIIGRGSSVLHGHQYFIMTLIIRGSGIQSINGKDILFQPGDLFFLSPSDFHSNTLTDGNTFDYLRLCFLYELMDARLSALFPPDTLPLHLHLTDECASQVENIFMRLIEECESSEAKIGRNVYLQALTEQLLILILRQLPPSHTPVSSAPVNRALGYVHAHFHEQITVGDAAAFVGYTPNHFNFCFRNQIGIPFGEYLRNMRLTYGENLLKASDMPVTEVAFESGFNSLTHFSRSFREKHGCSPMEFRNNAQQSKEK